MGRSRHPNKEIEAVVRKLELGGWRIEMSKKGHIWGKALCPMANRDGCMIGIQSTPRNAENHAKTILKKYHKCACESDENV